MELILKELKDSLTNYFNEYLTDSRDSSLTIEFIDEDKLVVKDYTYNQVMMFSWRNLISRELKEWYKDNKEKLDEGYDLWDGIFSDYLVTQDNPKVDYYESFGFFHKGYAEFILEYDTLHLFMGTDFFKIGNVECDIGMPSDMFVLINMQMVDDEHFYHESWDSIFTVKLTNVTKANFKKYLDQALFLIGQCNPPYFKDDYPYLRNYADKVYEEDSDTEMINFDFVEAEYLEAINFYNSGGRKGEVLYFYKVIEYFFIINRKQEILDLISNFNDIDKVIKGLTNIYKDDEESCLGYVLSNNDIKEKAQTIIDEAYTENLITENSIKQFAKQIYLYRNSVVHGKLDKRFPLRTEDILDNREDIWFNIIKRLAYICIEVFCYNDTLKNHRKDL
ncbi:hypothetical protein [Virgibacillus salexigens]|uniref:Apea-like HEPN domain-containing protein n=1 Tax=Virgibacillus kapii TaxID=1638645 RepID=A0ABQ2DQX2_9BACI|nr:hypothetical protein [Virgibacillus kapii]GGJ64475.1 hypothetical protein GCM10007111_27910 [Virgibacillus kapii]